MPYCIITTTCPNENEAKELALKLVENKLAACVQLCPISSFYTWKGKTCIDSEIRLTIKTTKQLYQAVENFIRRHHSYDVSQIIQIPITQGSKPYLEWIDENTISDSCGS